MSHTGILDKDWTAFCQDAFGSSCEVARPHSGEASRLCSRQSAQILSTLHFSGSDAGRGALPARFFVSSDRKSL